VSDNLKGHPSPDTSTDCHTQQRKEKAI
jgi:hypothetical protein